MERNSIRIGSVTLEGDAILAPLSGVTDVVMRRIARRYGAAAVVSEMVACDGLLRGETEARLRMEGEGVSPHIVQIAGRDPAAMAQAARLAEGAGADVIDINMGCPAKKVTGGLAGSALMRDETLAIGIVAAVVRAVTVPVTVKMRLGWCENSLNAASLARTAVAAGAVLITVHARTRRQFYEGAADWRALRPVREAIAVPLVVNGDIGSACVARKAVAASGADAVMIGRAAVGRPWLVGAIAAERAGHARRTPPSDERASVAIEHYQGLLSLYGRQMGVRHARKHLAAYADDLIGQSPHGALADDRLRLVTTQEPDTAIAILRRFGAIGYEDIAA